MARRSTAKRSRLIDDLLVEARRSGSLGTLHSRAAAPLAGLNATDWECLDVLDWVGPITAGGLGAAGRHHVRGGHRSDRPARGASGWSSEARDPADRRKVIVRLADLDDVDLRPDNRSLTETFAALGADVDEINHRFDDDQLAAIVQWLRETNAALERSIDRLRSAARRGD